MTTLRDHSEYSYYLPKNLLPDEETEKKFRGLLTHFVGTHSFHNYASTKGRELKEVRRRVQASIDKKNQDIKNAKQPVTGTGKREGDDTGARSKEETPDSIQKASAGDVGRTGGTKRERSKEWRTWRHKKKSAVDQAEEDAWYRKSKPASTGEGGEAAATEGGGSAAGEGAGAGRAMEVGQSAEGASSAAERVAVGSGASGDVVVGGGASVEATHAHAGKPVPVGGMPTGNVAGGEHAEELVAVGREDEAIGEEEDDGDAGDHEGYAAGVDPSDGEDEGGRTEEGPAKVLMLRELRTRCCFCFT